LSLNQVGSQKPLRLDGKFNIKNCSLKGTTIEEGNKTESDRDQFYFSSSNQKCRAASWLKNLTLEDGQFCSAYDERN
jgi:hypothetical protein